MVIDTEQIAFLVWLPWALLHYAIAAGAVVVVAIVVGYIVSAVRNGPIVALENTAVTLADAVVDLVLISPRRVWALCRLAIRDSLRRRIVVVFALFVLFLLFAGWFLDPGSDHPSRLYISVVLNWTSYLLLLLVLFLSATSLPADLKSQTLHTVVTKPVRASEIVLGRILGFTVIGTILLVVMGAISYVFVDRGLNHTHEVTQADLKPVGDAAAGKGTWLEGDSSRVNRHRHKVAVDPTGHGRLKTAQDHWHDITAVPSGDKTVYEIGPPQGMLIARVPLYGKLRFVNRERKETTKGVNVGDEWAYRSYIEGGSLAAAVWSFDGVRPEMFPDKLPLEMTLGVFRTHKGDIKKGITGSLLVRNPKTGLTVEAKVFQAKEFTTDVQDIPRKIRPANVFYLIRQKTDQDEVSYIRREVEPELERKGIFDLFDDLTDDGKMEIWLQCLDGAQYFGAAQADAYLRARDASFALNFAKGYFGIWLQMVLVIGFGVMFSTFLSAPVAVLATAGTLVGGVFRAFMLKLALGQTYGGGPTESLIRILTQQNVVSDMEPGLRTDVAQMMDVVLRFGLWVMANLLPEFGRFSNASYVAHGFDISGNWMCQRGFVTLGFVVALFVAGYFFLKTREIAK